MKNLSRSCNLSHLGRSDTDAREVEFCWSPRGAWVSASLQCHVLSVLSLDSHQGEFQRVPWVPCSVVPNPATRLEGKFLLASALTGKIRILCFFAGAITQY